VLLETLGISVSYLCVWTWIGMAIMCACDGRDLYVRVSGGFSLKDTRCAISARVRVWKLLVLLITIKLNEIHPLQKGVLRTSFPLWGVTIL